MKAVRVNRGFVVGLLALLSAQHLKAGSPPASGDPAIISVLAPVRERHQVPGMAAAIVTSRGLHCMGTVGVRKYGSPEPITVDDRWHLGSDTKAMTAVLAARLVDRGAIQWTTTVTQVFSDSAKKFKPAFKGVTLLHLLSHHAGLPANLKWSKFGKKGGSIADQRRAVVEEALTGNPASVPGERFCYSNAGYVIAGSMLEQVTGKPWESLLEQEVFRPLGIRSARFGGLGTPGLVDQPWGHVKPGRPVPNNGPEVDNPPVLGPAGRVNLSLADWSLFIADQLRGLRGESALLKPESYGRLFRPPYQGSHALGWEICERPWSPGKVMNHCGSNTMFYVNAWLAPELDFAVLVCANLGLDAFEATDAAVVGLLPLAQAARRADPGGRETPAAAK